MTTPTCQVAQCHEAPMMQFTRIERRRVAETTVLCERHGRARMHGYFDDPNRVGAGPPLTLGGGAGFDIAYLIWGGNPHPATYPCQVGLLEMGGARWFHIGVDELAWHSLNWELGEKKPPRPFIHRAMAATIRAFGGRLEYVEIDKVGYVETYRVFEAKLHIRQTNAAQHVVDVQPNDAIVLAIICDVPIIVSSVLLSESHKATDSDFWGRNGLHGWPR